MPQWRFNVSTGLVPLPLLEKSYFARWGRVPCQTLVKIQDHELVLFADNSGSGTVHVPRPNPALGITMEATESLLSREAPYILMKELARGAFGRFARRMFDWQLVGFVPPEPLAEQSRKLLRRFAQLVVESEFTPALEQEFVSLLNDVLALMIAETNEFTDQSLAWRMRNNEKIPLVFGIGMHQQRIDALYDFGMYAAFLQDSFQAVLPAPSWRDAATQPDVYDWERFDKQMVVPARFGFQIILGPLISFDKTQIPPWVLSRIDEDGFFESHASRFVNSAVERYGTSISKLILADRFTEQLIRGMPPSRSVSLLRNLAQQLRSRGYDPSIIAGINQPWGEYALKKMPEWEQVSIAEQLIACREIDTLLLDICIGCGEHLTLPRDPMCIGNMVDQWSFIGKKLLVSISVPSSGNIISASEKLGSDLQWSDELQRSWTETLLITLLGRRLVSGIFWSRLQDPASFSEQESGAPFCGLVSSKLELKPALKHFMAAKRILVK